MDWGNRATKERPTGTERARPQPGGHPVTREVAPQGFLLPHYRTFTAITNLFSRMYSYRYDEAIRKSRTDAKNLLNDVYFRALIRERIGPLGRWKWELEADPDDIAEELAANPKDPRSVDREKVRAQLQAILKRTPRLSRMRRSLGMGIWYGRQGVQWVPGTTSIAGQDRIYTARYRPIMGDKILFDYDGTPGVMVQRGAAPPEATVRFTDATMPVLLLDRPEYRERVIIHTHDLDDADITESLMAGRVEGVGVRDMIAWGAELRLELMSWIFDFMEKVGNLGLLLVYFEEGNAKSEEKAKQTAQQASGKAAIAVPRPKGGDKQTAGVELIPANMTGVQFLVDFMGNSFERYIERAIVGQSMSSGSSDGGGGMNDGGRAGMATDTKYQLLSSDADDQAETLTEDWVPVVQRANFQGNTNRYVWRYRVPDPEAKDKLAAITSVAGLPGKKLTFLADEVRELVGTTKPGEGDEIVGGDDVPPGRVPGAPGQPTPGQDGQPQPGGAAPGQPADGGEDDLFAPGEFEQLIGELGGGGGQPQGQGGQVAFLSLRPLIPYASGGQWTSRQLKAGPRKGQTVYENTQTGEIRDTPPEQRGGTPEGAGNPQSPAAGPEDQEYRRHVADIRAAGPQAVQAAKQAAVKVWHTLVGFHAKLLAAGISYEEALPDAKEMGNPLTGSTASHAGRDVVAEATGVPAASFVLTKIAPQVIGFALGKVKRMLKARGQQQQQQAQPQGQQPYQRVRVPYSASAWEPHTLKSGPREGQTVYKNRDTGEVRDTPPAEREGTPEAAGQQGAGGVKEEAKAAIVAALREAIGLPAADAPQPQAAGAGGPATPSGSGGPESVTDVEADEDEETEEDDDTDPIAETHDQWREQEPDAEGMEYDPKHQAARAKLQKQIEKGHEKTDAEVAKHREKQDAHREAVREKEDKVTEKAREKRDKKRGKDKEREEAAVEKAFDKELDAALSKFDDEVAEGLAESQANWREEGTPDESDDEEDIRDLTRQYEEEWAAEREKLEAKLTDERDEKLAEIEQKYDATEKEHEEADEAEDAEVEEKRSAEDEEVSERREADDAEENEAQEKETEEELAKFDAEALEKARREFYAKRKTENPDAHSGYYTDEEHAKFGGGEAASYQKADVIDLVLATARQLTCGNSAGDE